MAEVLITGREVCLKLPYGDLFTAAHRKEKCVFIAGGTGITPYLSLFSDISFKEYEKPSLYFGIREGKYNIYGIDLDGAVNINPGFIINIFDESVDGRLDIDKILMRHGKDAVYFISGPPVMIKAFKGYLSESGVGDEIIRTDDWE